MVIYPILVDTLTAGETFSATLYHIFIYEDYHYGYPFYALSQLVLLPVALLAGAGFAERTQLNLLLLRQLVSVLPLLLAGLVAVGIATRLRSTWKAALLYLVILTAPGIYTYNIRFWHPDGLNALFVVLVIFFLARDRLRFGRNFYLAAVLCGLSIATRLYGAFFFLSVGGCLLAGLLQKRIRFRQALLHGVGFILVMAAVLSWPARTCSEAMHTGACWRSWRRRAARCASATTNPIRRASTGPAGRPGCPSSDIILRRHSLDCSCCFPLHLAFYLGRGAPITVWCWAGRWRWGATWSIL